MKYEFERCEDYCAASQLTVNGIEADLDDFGAGDDKGYAEPTCIEEEFYGCYDRQFECYQPTSEVLEKYKITLAEYSLLVTLLESELSFGCCNMCE
jgi:hypothetical protein